MSVFRKILCTYQMNDSQKVGKNFHKQKVKLKFSLKVNSFNPLQFSVAFLYPLKTSENLNVF